MREWFQWTVQMQSQASSATFAGSVRASAIFALTVRSVSRSAAERPVDASGLLLLTTTDIDNPFLFRRPGPTLPKGMAPIAGRLTSTTQTMLHMGNNKSSI